MADSDTVVNPWFLGDVVKSTVFSAGRDVQVTLVNGNVLSVQQDYWPDFTDLIDHATRWFVGRGFVFEAFRDFMARERRGYFRLVAAAGLGKTAIAAELARRHRAPAYFLSTSAGRTSPETALNALSAQVIARYGLPHTTVPITAGATSDWLYGRLKEAAAVAAGEPVVVVIDALDEADRVPRGHNWLHLPQDLPDHVYVVLTQRGGTYQLLTLAGLETEEKVIKPDDPDQQRDVEDYLRRQVQRAEIRQTLAAALPPVSDETFVETLKSRSQGNFMYLGYMLDTIASRPPGASPIDLTELPRGLEAYYRQVWDQVRPPVEKPADWEVWDTLYRPVIELLAVAGEPVTADWLATLTGRNAGMIRTLALEPWTRFLMSGRLEGRETWSIFHRSFADFLAQEVDVVAANRVVANHYVGDATALNIADWDGYGLRYAATHLAEAAHGEAVDKRRLLIERLVDLVDNPAFRLRHLHDLRAPDALRRDFERALDSAADQSASTMALLTRAALALAGFRRELLSTVDLFNLAVAGDVEAAERHLSLFDLEPDSDWQRALRLAIAWLGHPQNAAAARALRARARTDRPESPTLDLLQRRVDAAIDGTPEPPLPPLPPPPDPHVAEQIVARLAGATDESLMAAGRELLAAQTHLLVYGGFITGDDAIEFLSRIDGPLLVALVVASPELGSTYFEQYLGVHSRYSYTTYRRGSLWTLLDSVVRHPDSNWVRGAVAAVGRTALVGGDVEFGEALGIATLALAAKGGRPGAAELLRSHYAPDPPGGVNLNMLMSELQYANQSRPVASSDPWGARKRRLGALAEALACGLAQPAEASVLIDQALALPFGFAGYQAPACLSLAESMVVARSPTGSNVVRALNAAGEAAHNIQDPVLCARTTARVDAMRARWWSPPASQFSVIETAGRLRQDPLAAEFAALHSVGEAYPLRSGTGATLPDSLLAATTLRELADAYQRPLSEFCRLNPAYAAAPDQPLPAGTQLNVPDPRLATLLAARIAAQALVDPSITAQQRVSAIWGLVPVAVGNPTALDSVLARLMLAIASPTEQLEELVMRSLRRAPANLGGSEITVTVLDGGPAPA